MLEFPIVTVFVNHYPPLSGWRSCQRKKFNILSTKRIGDVPGHMPDQMEILPTSSRVLSCYSTFKILRKSEHGSFTLFGFRGSIPLLWKTFSYLRSANLILQLVKRIHKLSFCQTLPSMIYGQRYVCTSDSHLTSNKALNPTKRELTNPVT